MLTTMVAHTPFVFVDLALWDTQRVAFATVRFGALAVRTVAVYGYPSNHPDAAEKNQCLFAELLSYLGTVKVLSSWEETLTVMSRRSRVGDPTRPRGTMSYIVCTHSDSELPCRELARMPQGGIRCSCRLPW